jgi:hypothetical protein
MINAIELSPHAEGTAYAAVTGYKLNDFAPYIYRTRNHGQRWERIDKGLPAGAFVRVVREDPVVPGLLYAGTEKGLFISWNDGGEWQAADLNLPAVPITDLRVREDALAVATQGAPSGCWMTCSSCVRPPRRIAAAAVHVYTPPAHAMGRPSNSGGGIRGRKSLTGPADLLPPRGSALDEGTALSIEIRNADGTVIRRYSSEESDHDRCLLAGMDPRSPFTLEYPAREAGLQRWDWDLHADDLPCIDGHFALRGLWRPRRGTGHVHGTCAAGRRSPRPTSRCSRTRGSTRTALRSQSWVDMQTRIAAILGGRRRARCSPQRP